MNPRLIELIDPKRLRPQFIKHRDIRGITPKYLLDRFGARAVMCEEANRISILVSRRNQKPDVYTFTKDGTFLSRHVNHHTQNSKKFISTNVSAENDIFTKVITQKDEGTTIRTIDTTYQMVKKPKKGFLGWIGLNSNELELKLRLEKESTNDMVSSNAKLTKWWFRLLGNKVGQLKAYSNEQKFKAVLLNKETYPDYSRLELGNNVPKLLKKAFKWFDGDFKVR